RNIADVTTSVAKGDLSRKITADARGEILELKNTINTMVDQLNTFASEVTRVAREVGTEGELGGQAEVKGVAGIWKNLTDNVNFMASNLTTQVRGIVKVVTAVANGDLKQKLTVDAKGEIMALGDTINSMTDTISTFAEQVSTVAREVGVEGELGGQAKVPGVAGTWKDLTDNVNFMASNLTTQVRGIVKVVTAVANGDLSQKLVVDAKGEVAALADTINGMTTTLGTFAEQVSTVAREVGIEGKLGGQAKVPGAMGTWRQLTDNVNQLAGNLTVQIRTIADIATAVTKGDLTRSITVDAQGEVASLKDNLNQMIVNLKETTQKNTEQDWLKTNLAKFSSMMQGQKNLETVSRMIMSELTPLIGAQYGAFLIMEQDVDEPILKIAATYALRDRKTLSNKFHLGESLVGQCALEKKAIVLHQIPADYVRIGSVIGEAAPLNVIVLPVLFEGDVKAVIELASFHAFSTIHQIFLDQLTESIGVVLNMMSAKMRTEELLEQSQSLTLELQNQSKELTQQQGELKRSNSALEKQAVELEDKAKELEEQNRKVEVKNIEVEQARASLEDKAAQLSMISRYKSEFLANMSHELRTPLNSLLILAKLLADNKEANLTDKQIEYARTVYASGGDLLRLINEILDLSKVEAGKMQVEPRPISLGDLKDFVERTFGALAEQKQLSFTATIKPGVPRTIVTDPQRLEQVLKNLLANAFKFTEAGGVELSIGIAPRHERFESDTLKQESTVLAFAVSDTGIGIAPDKQKLIFEAFQQADGTTSRKYGGTGLGLSISREISRLLGGEIHVHSQSGQGSTFTLYLPARYVALEGSQEAAPQLQAVTVSPPATVVAPASFEDDREQIRAGDRVLLIVEDDAKFAKIMLAVARERGWKGVVASRGDTGLALANELVPDAITLDIQLPVVDGWAVLDLLKRNPTTRHIPVHVISVNERRERGTGFDAFSYLEKPVSRESVETALAHVAAFLDRSIRRILLVEDDALSRGEIATLVAEGDDVEATTVTTAEEAHAALEREIFDCIVIDLRLPGQSGIAFIEQIKADPRYQDLPIIVHTAKELSRKEELRLRQIVTSIVVKGEGNASAKLVNDTAMLLHRVHDTLPARSKELIASTEAGDPLVGKKVLVVDDDARNVFALLSVFERHQTSVIYAENGKAGLQALHDNPDVDVVLMDVMMPEMDGYECMRAIRNDANIRSVPIIAITAKALKDDREKCIESGASDYLPKPVDIDKLLDCVRLWSR
ncbi:MAG: response regulator, partial [Polyangia bacterium]